MKKISFVVLSYNSEKYIYDCIKSILDIKNFNIEIYIIDNGSKDESVDIIESFKDNRIKLKKLDKNYGTTISRNIGLKAIKETDYVCILDSDTIVNEDAFVKMSDYLDNHNDVGIVGPSMVGKDGKKQVPFRKFPNWKIKLLKACPIKKISQKGEKLENYDLSKVGDSFECDYLISACWLMRYENCKKIGLLDEKIFYSPEDVEYCMRARKLGYSIVHLKNAQIIHLYQRISKKKMISKANITHLFGINYVLRKYKYFLKQYNPDEKIDFVMIWVDGNDPEWQKEKNKYDVSSNADGRLIRYRDWDLLKYWFRSVEKYTPWIHKIYFVTWGHIPTWLDTTDPRLVIVNHKDFIPEQYLPTFSSHTIELNIHRIKDLSDKFVYFNDDTYMIRPLDKKFFFKNGLPVDNCSLNVHCEHKRMIIQRICNNDVSIINDHFDIKKSIKKNHFILK